MDDPAIEPKFHVGDRVGPHGHWEFSDGTNGTEIDPPRRAIEFSEPCAWHGHFDLVRFRKGLVPCCVVKFDEPTHDDSGEGPYRLSTIDENSIVRNEGSPGLD